MNEPRLVYWDSSCFICFLNRDETHRRTICEDILRHAKDGTIQLWTSTWTIVEVIRPKNHGSAPLPDWAKKAIKAVPEASEELGRLWKRYQASDPATKLTGKQIEKISAMFEWPFVHKINVDERVSKKAVELARDFGLKPADAVHAAAAIIRKVSALQRWDRDFDKVKSLILVEEPKQLSQQGILGNFRALGPMPEEFEGGIEIRERET